MITLVYYLLQPKLSLLWPMQLMLRMQILYLFQLRTFPLVAAQLHPPRAAAWMLFLPVYGTLLFIQM